MSYASVRTLVDTRHLVTIVRVAIQIMPFGIRVFSGEHNFQVDVEFHSHPLFLVRPIPGRLKYQQFSRDMWRQALTMLPLIG